MKKIIIRFVIFLGISLNLQMRCTKLDYEEGATKEIMLSHNYIIVNSVNNTPVQVEVSYSVFMAENTENIIKTEKLTTPFVIGGEKVKVFFKEMINNRTNEVGYSSIIRNYSPKGADYLSIKNLSDVDLEYSVVGNQPLRYYSVSEINNWSNLSNKNQIDKSNVVKESPTPIYRGTPILYLLKPELAPQKEVYVPWAFGKCNGVSCAISDVQAKLISLKTPVFGDVTANSPFSISQIIGIYKQEYSDGNTLFEDYQLYRRGQISSANESIISNRFMKIKHYGTISAGQTLSNAGQVWFVNTHQGFNANDDLIN